MPRNIPVSLWALCVSTFCSAEAEVWASLAVPSWLSLGVFALVEGQRSWIAHLHPLWRGAEPLSLPPKPAQPRNVPALWGTVQEVAQEEEEGGLGCGTCCGASRFTAIASPLPRTEQVSEYTASLIRIHRLIHFVWLWSEHFQPDLACWLCFLGKKIHRKKKPFLGTHHAFRWQTLLKIRYYLFHITQISDEKLKIFSISLSGLERKDLTVTCQSTKGRNHI